METRFQGDENGMACNTVHISTIGFVQATEDLDGVPLSNNHERADVAGAKQPCVIASNRVSTGAFLMNMKNCGDKSASRGVGASRPVACAGTRKSAGRFSIMNLENEDEKLATTLHAASIAR